MAIKNGKTFRIKIGSEVITMEESFDFSGSSEVVEASNKDGDFTVQGTKTRTVNVSAHYDDDGAATNQFDTMYAYYESGDSFAITWGGDETGNLLMSGNGICTDINFSAAVGNTPASWTATISISGAFTLGTVST